MFAIGHVALGYLAGKFIGRATGYSQRISIILTLSLLPDIDLLVTGLQHRGPTHSVITAIIIFTPLLLMNFRKNIPYFTALLSHSMIGDFITDCGVKLFWPISNEWIKYGNTIIMGSTTEIYMELTLFAFFLVALSISGDFSCLFNLDKRNVLFFIPLGTFAILLLFKYPVDIPPVLIIPHLLLLSIISLSFSISVIQAIVKANMGADRS